MSRYLLSLITEGVGLGPVTQLLAVAEELTVRGHRCAFVAAPVHADLLRALGYDCFVAPVPDRRDPTAPDFRLCHAARALGITDADYFRKALAFEQHAVDLFRPDAMLAGVKMTAPITAASCGLPLAIIASSTDLPTFTSPLYPDLTCEPLPEHLDELLAEHGLAPAACMCELYWAGGSDRVAAYPYEFDPHLPPQRLSHVGPLLSKGLDLYGGLAGPLGSLGCPDRPLVVVYLNRGSQPVEHYLAIIGLAARALPRAHFVVVEQDAHRAPPLPDNVTVVTAAPILRLLWRARLFVCGGGYNAIMGALLSGIPIVGLPGACAERDYNMRRVIALGAGDLVSGFPVSPASAVAAIERAFGDTASAAAARAVGDDLGRMPGPAGVVEVLEALR